MKIMTRGGKVGICNICGTHGELTEDHTPPKGCMKPTQVQIRHISFMLSESDSEPKARKSQNGVKYKTLCKRCNNTLLGARYDPAFIDFVNEIAKKFVTSDYLAFSTVIRAKPQMILRSLIGHLAAQGVGRYEKGPYTDKIRDYLLDENASFPEGLYAFYWAYPHRTHVMARDVALYDIPTGQTYMIWFIKFFPVAFMVTWEKPQYLEYYAQSFEPWRHIPLHHEADMPLQIRPVPHRYWPEAPSDRTVVVYGQEAIDVNSR